MDKLLLKINRDTIFMHLALVTEIRCDLLGIQIVPVCNTSLRLTFQHVKELDNMVYQIRSVLRYARNSATDPK
jgi:hypothetical protein